MTPYERTRERYLNDAAFRHVVDVLQVAILDLHLTPFEVREAAMVASIMVEERALHPMKMILVEPGHTRGACGFPECPLCAKGDPPCEVVPFITSTGVITP